MLGGLAIILAPFLLIGLVWFAVWLTARERRRAAAAIDPATAAAADFPEQPVEFQSFTQIDPVRVGKGRVRIEDGMLVLRGRRRRLFSLRRSEERISLRDVFDVAVEDRLIRFRHEGQTAGRTRLLRLGNAEAARQLAAALPERVSEAGAQARQDVQDYARFLSERGTPFITLAIVVLNLAVYIFGGLQGAGWMSGNASVLYDLGGNLGPATAMGQWWRLVSAMFLHGGLMHMAFNMWALWDAGRVAERLFGHSRFSIIYLAAGLLGGLASINWQQEMVGVGASGAVFGVYGALVAALALHRELLPLSVAKQLMTSATVFIAYSLFNGFTKAGIDNAAHLGGLLAGGLLGAGLIASRQRMWASAVATVILLGVGAVRAIEVSAPLRDEPAFRAFMKDFPPEEMRLNEAAKKLFGMASAIPPGEFARRLDQDVVVGWRAQESRVGSLTGVTPRSREVREPIAQFISLKRAALEDLRDGLNRNDPQLLASSTEKFKQANALAGDLKRKAEERKGGHGAAPATGAKP